MNGVRLVVLCCVALFLSSCGSDEHPLAKMVEISPGDDNEEERQLIYQAIDALESKCDRLVRASDGIIEVTAQHRDDLKKWNHYLYEERGWERMVYIYVRFANGYDHSSIPDLSNQGLHFYIGPTGIVTIKVQSHHACGLDTADDGSNRYHKVDLPFLAS